MRRLLILGLGALCLLTFTVSQANALVAAPESCESDADCPESFFCNANCKDNREESDAVQCEGFCEPENNKNDCEVDTDCPEGFECIEHTSKGKQPAVTSQPDFSEAPSEAPCPQDEECEESGSEEPPPKEAPPADDQRAETEETVKTCAPKVCDTDADCGGALLCVLETYECRSEVPPIQPPKQDCAEGEDCGEIPEEEEPDEPQAPCARALPGGRGLRSWVHLR
jgi:hypothetical protein